MDRKATRLPLLAKHSRRTWEWKYQVRGDCQGRLSTWRSGLSGNGGPAAGATIARVRECLANDLDAPGALEAVDEWVRESLESGGTELGAPGLVGRALDALLGIRL